MKLRIKGDSLRLRLDQADVATLRDAGRVTDVLHVAPGLALTYGLEAADVAELQVDYRATTMMVLFPRDWLGPWASGDQVGFAGEQPAGEGRTLGILVEKDFACLHKRADEPDAFPHPHADAG